MKYMMMPHKRPMDVRYILRSSLASPILSFIIIIVMGTSDLYDRMPFTSTSLLALTLMAMVLRILIGMDYFLFGRIATEKAHRWSLNLNYFSAISWTLFASVTLDQYGLAWPGYLVILCAGALVSIIPTFSILPSRATKIYTGIFLLPIVAWGTISLSFQGHIIAVLALLYFIVTILVTDKSRAWITYLSSRMAEMDEKAMDLHKKNKRLEKGILHQRNQIQDIKAKKEVYRQAFQTSPNPIVITRLYSGIFNHINTIFSSQFGYSPKEVIGKTALDIGLWKDSNSWKDFRAIMRTNQTTRNFKCELYTRDGQSRLVLLSSQRITIEHEHFALTTVNDITKFTQAENQIKHLTRKIIQVQEEERKRIARDLHDSVAQDLSSLKITCSSLLEGPITASVFRTKIQDTSHVLQECIEAVKNIAYELRPPILDEMGLPTALFRHCDDFQRKTGIQVDFLSAGLNNISIESDTEINLYRLVQEALSNVLKHAHASKVTLRLVTSFPDIIMRVEDDGVGFDITKRETQGSKSMGLHSMAERVLLMEGHLRIITNPGEGTALVIRVPLNMSEQELEAAYKETKSIG